MYVNSGKSIRLMPHDHDVHEAHPRLPERDATTLGGYGVGNWRQFGLEEGHQSRFNDRHKHPFEPKMFTISDTFDVDIGGLQATDPSHRFKEHHTGHEHHPVSGHVITRLPIEIGLSPQSADVLHGKDHENGHKYVPPKGAIHEEHFPSLTTRVIQPVQLLY